jgi:hypothetical protein
LIWLNPWQAKRFPGPRIAQSGAGIWSNFAMRRTSRRWVAAIGLLGILGLQGALAAHACAMTFLPSADSYAAAVPATSSHCVAMAPKSTPQGSALCLEHCTKGKEASNASAGTVADAPAPMAVAFLTVRPSVTVDIANSWSSPQLQSRNNSPPVLSLSSRLRI